MPNIYTLYWKDGKKISCTGASIEEAFITAGFSESDVEDLCFYTEPNGYSYEWNVNTNNWVKI